jgi:uncharacterized RDD family membrane protein YckC
MNKNSIIAKYAVSRFQLCLGTFVGFIFYAIFILSFYILLSSAWELISGAKVEAPVVGFMSSYSKPAQNGYWIFVNASILSSLLLSAYLPTILGASVGKYLVNVRYVNENGDKISFVQTLLKAGCHIMLFLLIALPGPIIGFMPSFGLQDYLSLTALFVGCMICLYILFKKDSSGRTWAFVRAGIVPVKKSEIDNFKNDLMRTRETVHTES